MKLHLDIAGLAAFSSILLLASCSTGQFQSPLYLAVTISPRPASVPVNGTVNLKSTVSNNLSLPTWSILDSTSTPNPGTLTAVAGDADSILYTAPANPPLYNGSVVVGFTQGAVTIQSTVNPPIGSTLAVAHDSVTLVITAPTVAVGISPSTATVPLGTQVYFAAYATGTLNAALTYQVNGVTGGSPSTGTITTAGVYTAPTSLPVTGNSVTLTVISQADPTKTASATITLQ